jgi:flagellar basal-body rod protein FlgF
MASGIYTAMSGAVAQSQALDATANNIANADTTGFRAQRVSFAEALAQKPTMIHTGIAGGAPDSTRGNFRETGNPLDVAINGEGWFGVQTPQGVQYTRAGDFRLDDEGRLVTAQGLTVRAQGGGELSVPPNASEIHIEGDGSLVADGASVGQLEVAHFAPGALSQAGKSLYIAKAGSRPLGGGESPEIVSGTLEDSNFETVRGVIDLVKISRVYEALHRMVETYKQIDERSARDIGGK